MYNKKNCTWVKYNPFEHISNSNVQKGKELCGL